jgi:hypothetical protein
LRGKTCSHDHVLFDALRTCNKTTETVTSRGRKRTLGGVLLHALKTELRLDASVATERWGAEGRPAWQLGR